MLLRLAIASLLLAVSASAQHLAVESTEYGVTITLSRLESIVRYDPADPSRLALADEHADKPLDTMSIGDVLRWSVIVPDVERRPAISVEGQQWHELPGHTSDRIGSPFVTMTKAGLVNGVPVSILTIHPWQRYVGGIRVLSHGVVRIRFDNGLLRRSETPLSVPTYLPAVINGTFRSLMRSKTSEAIQETVRPETWLRKGAPYVKVHTRTDGLAVLSGKDVIAAESGFVNVATDRLQMWHKGREVPLHIRNDVAGTLLTDTTQIVFFGRRPYGDSTWFSLWDTTAVFYLTLADTVSSTRITVAPTIDARDTLRYIRMHRHVEYDTGHYHLGDADNADFGVFNSDVVEGEGFYWSALNASAYQRMKHAEFVYPVDTMQVDVSLYTVNNSPFDVDHRIDVSIDGSAPVASYSNGMGRRTASITLPADRVATGPSVVKIFATGIDSLRNERTYQSEAVIDYMVYRGKVLPQLDRGLLHGYVPARPTPTALELFGSRSSDIVVYDKTNNRLIPYVVRTGDIDGTGQIYAGPCATLQGSISHAEIPWPTLAPDPSVRRVTLMINDTVAVWDTAAKYSFLIGYADGTYARDSTNDPERCVALLNDVLAASARVMLAVPFGIPDEAVTTRLRTLGGGWSGISTLPGIITWGDQLGSQGYDQDGDGYYTFRSIRPTVSKLDVRYRHLIVLPSDTADVELVVSDMAALERPRIERPDLRYYASQVVPQTDIIYVTHREHTDQTDRLAEHRRDWNSLSTGIYDVDAIIDEYGAGTHSPYSVKAFLRDLYERAPEPKPRYLVLVGNASWDVRLAIKGGNVGARRSDQIPTYGRPSSDYWYGLIDDEADIRYPEMVVGRIPAITPEESRNHVDKIIHHDTVPFEPWMRTFFFIGGGTEPEGLCQIYESMLRDPFGTGYNLHDQPFCIDTVTLCAYPPRPNLGYAIRQRMNQGVEWMNFIGHGATDRFDIQGWDPNELDNVGRGGFMATYACQTGAFSNPSTPCKNATYLTEPRNGLVGAVGGTGWAWKYTIDALHYRLHDAMRTHGLRAVGDILYYGKTLLAVGASQDGVNTAMQQTLLGDPLSRVRIDTTADLYVRRQDVTATDVAGSTQLTEDDSLVVLRTTIRNAGVGVSTPVSVRIRRTFNDTQDTIVSVIETGVCAQAVVVCSLDVKNMVGEHRIAIEIDPSGVIQNEPRQNNTQMFTLDIYANSLLAVEPQSNWVVSATRPVVRMIDPNQADTDARYDFIVALEPDTLAINTVIRSTNDELTIRGSIIDWQVPVTLPVDRPLWLGHRRWINDSERRTGFTWMPIVAAATVPQHASVAIPSVRRSHEDASVVYDSSMAGLRLLRQDIPIFLRSSGVPTANVLVDPVLEIVIGDIPYVDNPYYRGMNVVVLGANDTIPKAIRRYDTWQDPLSMEEAGHNGFTREFLRFMRDSIEDDDRVFVAICNEAMTGFIKDTLIDSLRSVMRFFGSAAIDSLKPRASWVFYGRRGLAPGSAREVYENFPDSMVTMQLTIPYAAPSGSVRFARIGPAKRWSSLRVRTSGDREQVRSMVVGTNDDGSEVVLDTLAAEDSLWLPNDGAPSIAYVHVITEFNDDDPNDNLTPLIYGLDCLYDPADELLVESRSVVITPDDALRGDSVNVQATIRNAYRSQAASMKSGEVAARAENTTERRWEMPWSLTSLPADDSQKVVLRMPTSRLAAQSIVGVTIDPSLVDRELFRFNNTAATGFTVRDDSVPPRIIAIVDEEVATDGMYTVVDPVISIIVTDNSKLPINDSTRLTVFVNGDRIRPSITSDYAFYPTESIGLLTNDIDARAGMRFRYQLEDGQNNLLVRALDATGNSDTLELRLFTTDQLSFTGVSVAPNPVSGSATFLIELVADRRDIDGRIEIYGLRGERMRTLETSLRLGRSAVQWDGLDDTGATLPVGVYHARFIASDPTGPVTQILQFVVLR